VSLLDLAHPPPALWLEGDPQALVGPALSVVGSRSCTPYGRNLAHRIGRTVAGAAAVLVSGGARGIDTEAHRGALSAGRTVAVLGAGLAAPAAPAALHLRRDIVAAGGALVTELPPTDPARRWTFPRRNRLIAALGAATVVVEAGLRSGARITARLAADIGRDVYAVPGPVGAPASRGCLRLLAEGAHVVEDQGTLTRLLGATAPASRPRDALLAALEPPATAAEVAARLGRPPAEVLKTLALLELASTVRRLPGGRYGLP